MQKVHRAMTRSRVVSRGRSFASVALTVPGLGSGMCFEGKPVTDLLIPEIDVPEGDRLATLTALVSHLGDPVLDKPSRALLRGTLGRLVLDFALCAPTPPGRLARLLVVFGKRTRTELDVERGTLVVHDASGEYGVRNGVMVGGIYAGTPMALPLAELFSAERTVTSRSTTLSEIRRVLHSRTDPEAYQLFCLLYAVSEWDRSVPIKSLLLPKPRRVQRNLAELAKTLLDHPSPYNFLYRSLVPYFMTYSDFVATFGKPENRVQIGMRARTALINKLYMLPFFE